MDSYYPDAGDAPSLADESIRGEMDELLFLLEEKDADLRRAAELGKMLLDEKEADAEAHEGEKEALWRRIQDMARRVMELEQEAAESRDEFSLQQDQAHGHNQHQLAADGAGGGGGFSRRMSVGGGGGGDRAEERALRAKNEMLERQLAHMRDAAEEAQLELAAARKAQFSRRSSRHHHHARSRRSNSILSSPAASSRLGRAERSLSGGGFSAALGPLSPAGSFSSGHFPTSAAGGGGSGSTCVTPTNHRHHHRRLSSRFSSAAAPPVSSRLSVRSPRSAGGEGEGGDGDGAESEASNDELRAADRAHASSSAWRGRMEDGEDDDSDGSGEDEHDAAWLLEQNAWLMEELESKDELIEALREQLEELKQQQQQQQWGRQGLHQASSVQPLGDRDRSADSDDSDDSDDDSESGQRSFLDHLLQASGGGGGGKPTNQLAAGGGSSSTGAKEAVNADVFAGAAGPSGAGFEPAAATTTTTTTAEARARRATFGVVREKRRSFGGILTENARHDAPVDNPGGAESAAGRRTQSKSPTRAGRDRAHDGENSPVRVRSDKPQQQQQQQQQRAFSPTRRGAAVAEQAGEVTGVVAQAHDATAGAGAGAGGSNSAKGGSVCDAAASGEAAAAAAAAAAISVSEKVLDAAETKQVAAGAQQQQQEQEQPLVSSVSAASSATPVSSVMNPSAPAAAAAAAATPGSGVVERETTTVSGRKRVAAAAKAKAREREAAAAAAEAKKQQEASSSFAQMSRAEKKSRQAVEKLGLRTVKGVFRMTMRTTNGVVFVVKAPDVFKHPQQDTYVVFGAADTDHSGGEVSARPTRGYTPATATAGISLDGKTSSTRAAAPAPLSRPDPSAVESESVSAGLDPADVLTIVSHAGCSPRAAIAALQAAGGDVVNAVMSLTDAPSASVM